MSRLFTLSVPSSLRTLSRSPVRQASKSSRAGSSPPPVQCRPPVILHQHCRAGEGAEAAVPCRPPRPPPHSSVNREPWPGPSSLSVQAHPMKPHPIRSGENMTMVRCFWEKKLSRRISAPHKLSGNPQGELSSRWSVRL